MPLSPNSQFLVTTLESLPLLHGRFKNLKLVNFDSISNKKRGCFSLVFRADDVVESKPAALKFYDIDPMWMADLYRRACFAREADTLKMLVGTERCLQLVQDVQSYDLQVSPAPGVVFTIPCSYFAVEWLDEDIDRFFLEQDKIEALDKLKLFNEMILAVEALHRHDVFHRDLKADNFRVEKRGGKMAVVAIDLGTAAEADSAPIASRYGIAVGAPGYAAPEARCGLAGNRTLAPYTDVYALGCLLFELFNRDYFYNALVARNPGFDTRLAALALAVPPSGSDDTRVSALNGLLVRASHGVTAIRIDAPGNSVDPAINSLLTELVISMTNFDYRRRPNLEAVRNRLWIAIRV